MSSNGRLTVLGHLGELRSRLIRSVIAVVITSIIAFIFADWIFYFLVLPAGSINLIYVEMTEMLGTYMRVCLAAGIALAMPYLVYQVIMFVSPALTPREKKYIYLALPWIGLMFIGGVLFGYFVLIPPALKFLLGFGSNIATPQIKIGSYISLVTRLLLAIGLVFELPVITTFLAKIGVVKAKWLASKRRPAIIFAFILAAVITPTFDPINQTLVAAPLVVLYELSIWLARLVQKKESKTATVP
jgi:sec-independent protein translocase protein TatC